MLIIVDYRIPEIAIDKLSLFGEVCLFNASGLVPDYLSGHPDIFITQCDDLLIVAPNTPERIINSFKKYKIQFVFGENPVGNQHPFLSYYNAVVGQRCLIHNLKYTDPVILKYTQSKRKIHVKQSFTRCSLLTFGNDCFITSDKGIYKELKNHELDPLFVNSHSILLEGLKNGLWGGCCGVFKNKIVLTGSLQHIENRQQIEDHITKNDFYYVELTDDKLLDVGGIFFVKFEK